MRLRAADLVGARAVTYRLEQAFRYDYTEPVTRLRHRLVIVPPRAHADVARRSYDLRVAGAAAQVTTATDAAGNVVVDVHAERVDAYVEFALVAVLERVAGTGTPPPVPDRAHLLAPTPLTAPDDALTAWAASLPHLDPDRAPGAAPDPDVGLLATAEGICRAVRARLTYRAGATTATTTAAQALAGGVGVCQDFAHVMLALCRLRGVPARYVSGHLLGQGGTHAWVEVAAGGDVVAFDPCNGGRTGPGHVTVATGRDYTDVAPTAGTYCGPRSGQLTSRRSLRVVDVTR